MNTIKRLLDNQNFINFITGLAYVSIALTVIGQCVMGVNFYFGQGAYLFSNVINCCRDIILKRPKADKIKNFTFLGITIGLMLLRYFSVY